jgi:hypothetical protein
VADVRRLVRVDVRVLDDELAGVFSSGRSGRSVGRMRVLEHRPEDLRAVHEEVQVAAAFDGPLHDDVGQDEGGRELLGDLARRPLQDLGELERDGAGEVAQLDLRRGLEDEARGLDAESLQAGVDDCALERALEADQHGGGDSRTT